MGLALHFSFSPCSLIFNLDGSNFIVFWKVGRFPSEHLEIKSIWTPGILQTRIILSTRFLFENRSSGLSYTFSVSSSRSSLSSLVSLKILLKFHFIFVPIGISFLLTTISTSWISSYLFLSQINLWHHHHDLQHQHVLEFNLTPPTVSIAFSLVASSRLFSLVLREISFKLCLCFYLGCFRLNFDVLMISSIATEFHKCWGGFRFWTNILWE